MRSRPFILLDLQSQVEFIPNEIQKWPRDRFLSWLRLFGEVDENEPNVIGEIWTLFAAPTGLRTVFALTDDGRIRIYYGEHTIQTFWT